MRTSYFFFNAVSSRSCFGKDSKWPIMQNILGLGIQNTTSDCSRHDVRFVTAEDCCDSPYHHTACVGVKILILDGVKSFSMSLLFPHRKAEGKNKKSQENFQLRPE